MILECSPGRVAPPVPRSCRDLDFRKRKNPLAIHQTRFFFLFSRLRYRNPRGGCRVCPVSNRTLPTSLLPLLLYLPWGERRFWGGHINIPVGMGWGRLGGTPCCSGEGMSPLRGGHRGVPSTLPAMLQPPKPPARPWGYQSPLPAASLCPHRLQNVQAGFQILPGFTGAAALGLEGGGPGLFNPVPAPGLEALPGSFSRDGSGDRGARGHRRGLGVKRRDREGMERTSRGLREPDPGAFPILRDADPGAGPGDSGGSSLSL